MFLDIDKKNPSNTAFIDDSRTKVTYGELADFTKKFTGAIGGRTLAALLCRNTTAPAAGFAASMSGRIVPLLIGASVDASLRDSLLAEYSPEYLWAPQDLGLAARGDVIFSAYGYELIKTEAAPPSMYEELSMLLTTSGSTGSPKLVRHTYKNVEANAEHIAQFFGLDENERAMLDLPMQYTYGLSVLYSHLYAGAQVILSEHHVVEMDYWTLFKECGATNITGVPYCYEMMKKLRVMRMNLPTLKTLSQGGGKLSETLQKEFAGYAAATGRKFYVTYGATEATARMAFLPPELAAVKLGSIGNAIPGGRLSVVDENDREITEAGVVGELVYEGSNVTLGYAQCAQDLAKGDERHGRLCTGDMAKKDEDGFFYIVGRKKRFLKIFGSRVSLDEVENILKTKFETDFACVGKDDEMKIFVTTPGLEDDIISFITEKTHFNKTAFAVRVVPEIPKNDAGKTLYAKLI